MRPLLFSLLVVTSLSAQNLSFAIHNSTNNTDTPLTSPYQFPNTEQGSASSIVIEAKNISISPVLLAVVYVGVTSGSSQASPNFSITGLNLNGVLAPGDSTPFTLNFTPSTTGAITGLSASRLRGSAEQLRAGWNQ